MNVIRCSAVGFFTTVSLLAQTSPPPTIELRLVSLRDGMREMAPKRDLQRFVETEAGKAAVAAGMDLFAKDRPVLVAGCSDGRLFHVFYKTLENAFGERAWLVQRIKKTERTWAKGATKPDVKVTWQVEAFKTSGGGLKRPDQHFGSFALRDAVRREIVKEYEIGFGSVPGVAESAEWPFPPERLFEAIQPYQEDAARYDEVTFTKSRKWSLEVAFAADGTWRVASPELGFDAPKTWPDAKATEPRADATSKDVVLEPGKGIAGAYVGQTAADDLAKALGPALEDVPTTAGVRLLAFGRSMSASVKDGTLNTLLTRPGFVGRTKDGICHGMTRQEVAKRRAPRDPDPAATQWSFEGLLVDFDGNDRVRRLVITAPR